MLCCGYSFHCKLNTSELKNTNLVQPFTQQYSYCFTVVITIVLYKFMFSRHFTLVINECGPQSVCLRCVLA